MAWTAPVNTFISGNVLTAAQMNAIGDNLWAGGPVYATYADLIAAITSPFEGQRAYITGPVSGTVTATGAITAVPTGINVVYNGAAWVCTTEVGGGSNTSATTSSTSYVTTLTSDGTAISCSLLTGTTAMISYSAIGYNNTAASSCYATISVSGATTIAAADSNSSGATSAGTNYGINMNRTMILTGLTAGVNTFTLNYKVNSGTATYLNRNLVVKGIA
jgi:hypothetical protein